MLGRYVYLGIGATKRTAAPTCRCNVHTAYLQVNACVKGQINTVLEVAPTSSGGVVKSMLAPRRLNQWAILEADGALCPWFTLHQLVSLSCGLLDNSGARVASTLVCRGVEPATVHRWATVVRYPPPPCRVVWCSYRHRADCTCTVYAGRSRFRHPTNDGVTYRCDRPPATFHPRGNPPQSDQMQCTVTYP